MAGHISFSLIYKTLRAVVGLFFSNIFQSTISYQLYLFINGLIFEAVSGCNSISP